MSPRGTATGISRPALISDRTPAGSHRPAQPTWAFHPPWCSSSWRTACSSSTSSQPSWPSTYAHRPGSSCRRRCWVGRGSSYDHYSPPSLSPVRPGYQAEHLLPLSAVRSALVHLPSRDLGRDGPAAGPVPRRPGGMLVEAWSGLNSSLAPSNLLCQSHQSGPVIIINCKDLCVCGTEYLDIVTLQLT